MTPILPSDGLAQGEQAVSFWVNGVLFGIRVTRVREVLHGLDIEPVPRAPEGVLGLASRRGQVIAAIDARVRLGLPARVTETDRVFLLVDSGNQLDCLVVDREDEVVDLAESQRSDVPETIDAGIRDCVVEVFQRDNGLLLMLDIDRVLAVAGSKGAS